MRAEITDRLNGAPDVVVDAAARCGTDFCDRCGDCLYCYASDPCYGGGTGQPHPNGHRWVVYADLDPERASEVLAASVASR